MTNGDPIFPLLRLSPYEMNQVLKSMGLLEMILFSFSTKKSKTLIESLHVNLWAGPSIEISNGIDVSVTFPNKSKAQWIFYCREFENRQPNQAPMEVTLPGSVTFLWDGYRYDLTGMQLALNEWLDHIKAIFHTSKVNQLIYEDDEGFFNVESIRDAVGNVDSLDIQASDTDEQNQERLTVFLLRKDIGLGHKVWQSSKPPGSVLIQNFDDLQIGICGDKSSMTLDDLLMINGKVISVFGTKFTEKDMNRFLRIWIRRRNSGRMEHINVQLTTRDNELLDKTAVLRGIHYQEVNVAQRRWFKPSEGRRRWPIEGGYDIIARDGTRATISFDEEGVEMHVWHDYCR